MSRKTRKTTRYTKKEIHDRKGKIEQTLRARSQEQRHRQRILRTEFEHEANEQRDRDVMPST